MKKCSIIIILSLILIVCCISIVGCDTGFKLVKSISITTNGKTEKFESWTTPSFSMSDRIEITEEEYHTSGNRYIDYGIYETLSKLSKITVKKAIKEAHNSTHYEVVEEELQGYWYYSSYNTHLKKYQYFKSKYKNTYFNFVYAKVKNDTTVIIKCGTAKTTYTVTSYNIVKF